MAAARKNDEDARIDALYDGSLDDFIARRDALAKELRTAGDRDAAARVKKLRKPARVAWAVSQAARAQPKLLDAVTHAGAALQRASQRAVSKGDASGLREAVRERQDAVRAMTSVAVDALTPRGESVREAIEQTINALSVDPEAAKLARAGRLTDELAPPDVFSTLEPGAWTPATRPTKPRPAAPKGAPKPAATPRPTAKPTAATAQARDAERRREVKEAQRALEAAQRAEARARAHAEELSERARRAIENSDAAHRAASDAAARTREARRALAALER
jgi:hypothetical protein